MKDPKKSTCKWCAKEYTKQRSTQQVCSLSCAIDYEKAKRAKAIKSNKAKEAREWSKRKKALKNSSVTSAQLKKRLQSNINEIARKIDFGNKCTMCDKDMRKPQGCHYHSVGSNGSLRFNLLNIWVGCYACNVHKSGNILGYDEIIIQKMGNENWRHIKFDLVKKYPLVKFSNQELIELISYTGNIKKNIEEKYRSSMERWMKRVELNELIGIYK